MREQKTIWLTAPSFLYEHTWVRPLWVLQTPTVPFWSPVTIREPSGLNVMIDSIPLFTTLSSLVILWSSFQSVRQPSDQPIASDWKVGCHFRHTACVLPRDISKFGINYPSSFTKTTRGLFVAIAKIMLKSLLLQAQVTAVSAWGKAKWLSKNNDILKILSIL